MCNLYSQTRSPDELARIFLGLQMPISFPEGVPNLQPKDIGITDVAPIVRCSTGKYQLIMRRWSWPGPTGKPVYNFRSDGREFTSGRVLIVTDGFYEFTKPTDPKQKRKDRWLFTAPDEPLIGIAGIVRQVPGVGEAFTMLTTEPGPDVAPYHSRQVAVLPSAHWSTWLGYAVPATDLLGPLAGGFLHVEPANR